jgi:hypothetical protein
MSAMSDNANPSTTVPPTKKSARRATKSAETPTTPAETPTTPAEPPSPLSLGWRAWCKILEELRKTHGEWEKSEPACQRLLKHLHRFTPNHPPDPPVIKNVTRALYRAVPLLQAAILWEEPSVGGKAEKRSATDRRRGEQWRLVLSFSGFETLGKALLAIKGRGGIKPEDIGRLLAAVPLPDHVPLDVPSHKEEALDDWFNAESQDELLDFLCLDHGDAKITATWLVERKPMVTWLETFCLAKALRNATVHGALSASKITEWKLGPALLRMVDDIAAVAGAVLIRLTADIEA